MDIELYPNYFLALFYDPYTREHKTFQLWEVDGKIILNDLQKLKNYLAAEKDTYFCGYNSLGYDMNILTAIIKEKFTTNKQIKEFNDFLINSEWPVYREQNLCNKTLDLMLINNYGPKSAKSTSLKKLEFNLRKKKIQDLPYHFNDFITKEVEVGEIIKYCKYDIEVTIDIFRITKDLINMRVEFTEEQGLDVLNSPEPDLAKKFVYRELASYMGVTESEFKNLRSYQSLIDVNTLILPFISFTKSHYKEVLDYYNSLSLTPSVKSVRDSDRKVINLKNVVSKTISYDGLETVYGAGGIHAAVSPGIYEENDDYMITTADFTSYYPHLQFIHDCIAQHIPSELYSKLIRFLFSERKKYAKGTALNYAYKILINLLYGLSNSEYSALYDTRATLKTTINGMLIISMIADKIYDIPNARILMKNTDGLEIYHLRSDKDKVIDILNSISSMVSIPIEINYYKKMVINDVNNYIAIDIYDNVKTKGLFEDYDDIIKAGAYHKDTSAMIIPKALKAYFINGIPVEETIHKENSIYEFCYGNKGSNSYRWMITKYNPDNSVSKSELFDSRFVRYFAGGYDTLSQFWIKGARNGTIQAVQAQTPITMLMNVPKEEILDFNRKGEWIPRKDKDGNIIYRYPNLNKDWYIAECYKIINQINN
jgi:DNA polymerase